MDRCTGRNRYRQLGQHITKQDVRRAMLFFQKEEQINFFCREGGDFEMRTGGYFEMRMTGVFAMRIGGEVGANTQLLRQKAKDPSQLD
jgi:hypothetical protein